MSTVNENTMNEETFSSPGESPATPGTVDWALIRRQISGVMRLELRRNFWSRRSLTSYFLALAPVVLMAFWSASPAPQKFFGGPVVVTQTVFPLLFESVIRTSLFMATILMFMSLFRSEILERSLHYYFLTPIRREVLVVGKYLSAQVALSVLFMIATTLLYCLTLLPWGISAVFQGIELGNLIAYLGIVILACAGYGAVFLLVGLFFRNPIVPAAMIWVWELINFLLPPLLQKLSVIHYLQSLYPIPLQSMEVNGFFAQLFEVVVEPTPAWLSVPGILLFTSAVLFIAGWRARRMEINYGGD